LSSVLKPDALELLNKEIDESGVKNKYIANKIGVSEQYISLILSGKRKLTADKVIAISKVLGIDYRIFLS
jgi:plasmid maintenance system antidote protein VapI